MAAFTNTQSAIANYEKQMFSRFGRIGQGTLFNTEWMNQFDALNKMLSMFSKNKLKQGLFMSRMWLHVYLFPFVRKTVRLAPKQKVLSVT